MHTRRLANEHPEIASHLVHPEAAQHVGPASTRMLIWRCPNDATHPNYPASVINRVASSARASCPQCQRQMLKECALRPRPGRSLAEQRPDLSVELADPTQGEHIAVKSTQKVTWQCLTNPEHANWEAVVVQRTASGSGCPKCASEQTSQRYANLGHAQPERSLANKRPELIQELQNPDDGKAHTFASRAIVEWKCLKGTGHPNWKARISTRTRKNPAGCPECGKESRRGKRTRTTPRTAKDDNETTTGLKEDGTK